MSYNPLLSEVGADYNDSKHSFDVPRWWKQCLEPTTEFTLRQKFWIWQNTVLTCWASFGVSYMAGYFLLANKPKPTLDDMLLNFIATAFLTPLLNWLIGCTLMSGEVLMGRVAVIDPRNISWWPKETEPQSIPYTGKRWWFTTSDTVLKPPYYPKTNNCCSFTVSYVQRLIMHISRALPWMVASIITTVPVFYVFSLLVYGQHNYNSYPQPQLMTGIQACIISLLTIPLWSRIVLANMGSKLVHDETYIDFTQDIDPTGDNVA